MKTDTIIIDTWEQRRFEIAKDAYLHLISRYEEFFMKGERATLCAKFAIQLADVLVKELKEAEEEDEKDDV